MGQLQSTKQIVRGGEISLPLRSEEKKLIKENANTDICIIFQCIMYIYPMFRQHLPDNKVYEIFEAICTDKPIVSVIVASLL